MHSSKLSSASVTACTVKYSSHAPAILGEEVKILRQVGAPNVSSCHWDRWSANTSHDLTYMPQMFFREYFEKEQQGPFKSPKASWNPLVFSAVSWTSLGHHQTGGKSFGSLQYDDKCWHSGRVFIGSSFFICYPNLAKAWTLHITDINGEDDSVLVEYQACFTGTMPFKPVKTPR